jgi:hypothetical protein
MPSWPRPATRCAGCRGGVGVNVMAVTANHFQISKTARVNASLHGEMMTLVIIALVVVSVLYFAWDEISAARATKKESIRMFRQ